MGDLPARLIVAYSLIALLIAAASGIVWWSLYHSHSRTAARERARRRAARLPNDDF